MCYVLPTISINTTIHYDATPVEGNYICLYDTAFLYFHLRYQSFQEMCQMQGDDCSRGHQSW